MFGHVKFMGRSILHIRVWGTSRTDWDIIVIIGTMLQLLLEIYIRREMRIVVVAS